MIATLLPRRRWGRRLLLAGARQAQHLSRVLALQRHLRAGEGSPVAALQEVDALAVRPGVPLVIVPLLQEQREAEAARLDGAAACPLAAIAAGRLVRLEEREVGLVGARARLDPQPVLFPVAQVTADVAHPRALRLLAGVLTATHL